MRPFWRQVRVKIEPGIGQQVTLNNTLKTLKIKRTARETAASFSNMATTHLAVICLHFQAILQHFQETVGYMQTTELLLVTTTSSSRASASPGSSSSSSEESSSPPVSKCKS